VDYHVADANEAPTDLALSANSVAEHATTGTVVGTISGTDPDAGDTKTYSLTDTAGGRFAINSATGEITVADGSLLNYEAATRHNLTVQVTDSGGQSYSESFTINLTNVNEAPIITSNGGGATAAVNVAENQNTVTMVAAMDVDTGATLAYSIAGGPDAARFSIDSTTGALRFSTAPNFERPSDVGRNNVYGVTVQVSDGQGGTATQSISVRVTDVNEAPRITSNRGGDVASVTIRENGSAVTTVRATDLDRGARITYSVVGGTDSALFTINPNTGVLHFSSAPNFERPTDTDRNNVYQVVVQASDGRGGADSQVISIRVTNVNEAPTDLSLSAHRVAENATTGTVVGTITGSDADSRDTKTYSLTDTAGGRFAINGSTGVITVANGTLLNYESAQSHNITVQVTDRGGLTYRETFRVDLTNVNDAPTDLSLSTNTVAEHTANGTVVGTVSGTDPDAGDTKTYSLTDTAGGRFAINASTGEITVADGSLLNYEAATSHPVTVRVTDSGGQSYIETFTINLTNVNEAPTGADATVTISEDTSHTLTTANFRFSDIDAGDSLSAVRIDTLPTSGTLTLSGVAVTAGQVIAVSDITGGHLVFTPTADANGTGYASLTFSIRDSHSTYDRAPNTLAFNLTAVNDAPTDLSLSANSVAENASTGTVVGTVSGTDVDAGDTKTYSLTDTADGRFAIDSATGQLTVADGSLLNYENAASHSLTVQVTDSGGQSYTETFTINLTNVNEMLSDTESTDALIEDMLATTRFGTHDTYGAPKTSASDPHVANDLEESGFPLANTFQNMSKITTEAPSTEIILTAERTHLSVASEEPSGNGVNSKETQRSSTQNEKPGSDVPFDQTDGQSPTAAETDRKDFLEPDNPIENVEESTALNLSATMGLAGVVLQNSPGNNSKLSRLIPRPASASHVPPNTTPQKSPVDDHASNQNGSEHSRSAAEDADQADP
jgi:VCBS repeat-containing protein